MFLIHMVHLLRYSKQQVIADGNPYLRIDRILACPVEGLDVKMILIHLKKHSTCHRSR